MTCSKNKSFWVFGRVYHRNAKNDYSEDNILIPFAWNGKNFIQKGPEKKWHASQKKGDYLVSGVALGKVKSKKKDTIVVSFENRFKPGQKGKIKIFGIENDNL